MERELEMLKKQIESSLPPSPARKDKARSSSKQWIEQQEDERRAGPPPEHVPYRPE